MAEDKQQESVKKRLKIPLPALASLPFRPLLFVGSTLAACIFIWFFCRIEPGAGEIAVLIRKTGDNLPPGEVLALGEGQKGIQLEVLAEGRYFKNPYTWSWRIRRILDVPAGKLGVMTRLYGEELPSGRIIAEETSVVSSRRFSVPVNIASTPMRIMSPSLTRSISIPATSG